MLNEHEEQKLMQAIRGGYMLPERSGEYWSDEEREKLSAFYHSGVGLSGIALELQRSETAIVQQLMAMGLMTAPNVVRTRRPREPSCLCGKCRFNAQCIRKGGCFQWEGLYAGQLG